MSRRKHYEIGQVIGKKTITGPCIRENGRNKWPVRCECGHETLTLTQGITRESRCIWCSHKELRPYRRKREYEGLYNSWNTKLDKLDQHKVYISYDEFITFTTTTVCHYCDAPIYWMKHRIKGERKSGAVNLDRKDSMLPYTMDNVVVCCKRCNIGKNTHFTYEEWKQLGNVIKTWRTNASKIEGSSRIYHE
jgi:hypothetical protein